MLKTKLELEGIKMGRDGLHALLASYQMTVRPLRRYRPKTTWSDHWMRKWPNQIKDFQTNGPNQLWVSDITYIRLKGDFCFLFLITDAYSHKIVGWALEMTMGHEGAITALKMALNQWKDRKDCLIHHSDRGSQYCCDNYVKTLQAAGISVSMTQSGDPRENAVAERVNGILKVEMGLNVKFETLIGAKRASGRKIDIYNHDRPHLSCDMMAPAEAHQTSGPLKKRWKNTRTRNQRKEAQEKTTGSVALPAGRATDPEVPV
ncbi:MAG: IS3 family transposase [Bacteroidia bacterium]|nr:IS3 family transposase [Bacteroidia bacterium]